MTSRSHVMIHLFLIVNAFLILIPGNTFAGDSNLNLDQLPPAANRTIVFQQDVKPILERSCLQCHGENLKMGNFHITSRAAVLQGGPSGPALIPGDSRQSLLIHLVSGLVPDKFMPLSGDKLTPEEIGVLRAWIDQGAAWDEGVSLGGSESAATSPLSLHPPRLPDAQPDSVFSNPIDLLLQDYYAKHRIDTRKVVDDRLFARRVYLDVIGLLPSPGELAEFVNDPRPDKRERLVRKLLLDNRRYAEHWMTFWNDLLRNENRGTGFIDGGREQISQWLYRSLEENKPYDVMVAELIDPVSGSEGFIKGIIWRGVVNASQTPPMQAAQNLSQAFMGINLKCASCHDSFINNWKLKDAYGLAGVFSEKPLEMVRCDVPQGVTAPVKFLYPELGEIDPSASLAERRKRLAYLLTRKENGRFPRTFVNRLWAQFFGRGIVEPVDDMDAPPWNAELLEWLAYDFAKNDFDIQRAIRLILTSAAYQLPAVDFDSNNKSFVFDGPIVRRMTAEQFSDAMSALTGTWPAIPHNFFRTDDHGQAPGHFLDHDFLRFAGGRIHSGSAAIQADISGATILRLVSTDNQDGRLPARILWVNPKLTGPEGELDLTTLSLKNATTADASMPETVDSHSALPADIKEILTRGWAAHSQSVLTFHIPPGYTSFQSQAVLLDKPDNLQIGFETKFFVLTGEDPVRASLADSNPLMQALGRPNREQVVTRRDSQATTLQALELSNGNTLQRILKQGARNWLKEESDAPTRLVSRIFQKALGRDPAPAEMEVAQAILGGEANPEGVEDLLWIIAMKPEFQLIY